MATVLHYYGKYLYLLFYGDSSEMNLTNKIVCVAKLLVKKDCLEEVINLFQSMIQLSQKEEGCLSYTLQRDVDNPLAFIFIDYFKDKNAFDFHCAQDYIVEYFDHRFPQLTDESRLEIYKEVIFN